MKEVLKAYDVYPNSIDEVTNNLFKVTDHSRTYALKRSSLTATSFENWEYVYYFADRQNLSSILPVYLTKNGELSIQVNNFIYYLTPWIDEERTDINKSWLDQFYTDIATIHVKSKRTQIIPIEKIEASFRPFKAFCKNAIQRLLDDVKQFEKSRYMSPFELLVCTQYRDVELALNEAINRIDQFLDKEDDEISWNYSLCHQNLNTSHIRNNYFINWEKASFENAISDLVSFFMQETGNYDQPVELFTDSFSSYMNVNELNASELQLLSIYLLTPTNYMSRVQQYVEGRTKLSQIEQIKLLQKAYRQLMFGLTISKFIEKEYETISFEDLEN